MAGETVVTFTQEKSLLVLISYPERIRDPDHPAHSLVATPTKPLCLYYILLSLKHVLWKVKRIMSVGLSLSVTNVNATFKTLPYSQLNANRDNANMTTTSTSEIAVLLNARY